MGSSYTQSFPKWEKIIMPSEREPLCNFHSSFHYVLLPKLAWEVSGGGSCSRRQVDSPYLLRASIQALLRILYWALEWLNLELCFYERLLFFKKETVSKDCLCFCNWLYLSTQWSQYLCHGYDIFISTQRFRQPFIKLDLLKVDSHISHMKTPRRHSQTYCAQ